MEFQILYKDEEMGMEIQEDTNLRLRKNYSLKIGMKPGPWMYSTGGTYYFFTSCMVCGETVKHRYLHIILGTVLYCTQPVL